MKFLPIITLIQQECIPVVTQNGAFFTYALACYHSDKIAAIGSVAGTMMEETYSSPKSFKS